MFRMIFVLMLELHQYQTAELDLSLYYALMLIDCFYTRITYYTGTVTTMSPQ